MSQHGKKVTTSRKTAIVASIIINIISVGYLDAQTDTSTITQSPEFQNIPAAFVTGPNLPEGFMDINFGTSLEDAEKLLAARNYNYQKRNDWNQIILKNAPLAGLSAHEVTLSFNSELGFYKGEAKLKVDCDKSQTQGVEAFEKIIRSINKKYRKIPKVQQKFTKEKRNYWNFEWEFRTKDNKHTAYEIKLYMQDDWKSVGRDWQKTSNLFITYLATRAVPKGPTPPEPPSEGL